MGHLIRQFGLADPTHSLYAADHSSPTSLGSHAEDILNPLHLRCPPDEIHDRRTQLVPQTGCVSGGRWWDVGRCVYLPRRKLNGQHHRQLVEPAKIGGPIDVQLIRVMVDKSIW